MVERVLEDFAGLGTAYHFGNRLVLGFKPLVALGEDVPAKVGHGHPVTAMEVQNELGQWFVLAR